MVHLQVMAAMVPRLQHSAAQQRPQPRALLRALGAENGLQPPREQNPPGASVGVDESGGCPRVAKVVSLSPIMVGSIWCIPARIPGLDMCATPFFWGSPVFFDLE